MSNNKIYKDMLPSDDELSRWPKIDTASLTEEKKAIIAKREEAVMGYFSDKPLDEVAKSTGFTRQFITKLVKKCLADHEDNRIWGFRALLPNVRLTVIKYTRVKECKRKPSHTNGGYSGALDKLFERFPDIKEKILGKFVKKIDKILAHESKISIKALHNDLITECRAHGIVDEYPFNVKYMGRIALLQFLQDYLLKNHDEGVGARYGEIAKRMSELGGPDEPRMSVDRPYRKVEFDGHHIDITFIIEIPAQGGGTIEVTIDRLWILVIRECMSGAILSYSLAYGRQYTKYDVMKCIKRAVVPWKRVNLTLPGLKYHEHGGMPSEFAEELKWIIFEEFSYDSAKANIANECKRLIKEVLGATPNNGPLAFPEYRPMVEAFFKILEENGFHRLPSTLGGNPTDIRRTDPEKQAIKFKIRLEHLEELIAVMISNFNGNPAHRISYRTPLEYLKYYALSDDARLLTLEESKRGKLYMFNEMFVKKVRGSAKQGKRPHIHFMMANYTSPILANAYVLIGTKLTLYIDPDDARYALAFLPDGKELGILTAKGYWGRTKHSIETRRAILNAKHKQLINYTENDDPIQVYTDYINKESIKSKSARKSSVKLQKSQDATTQAKLVTTENSDLNDVCNTSEKQAVKSNSNQIKKNIVLLK